MRRTWWEIEHISASIEPLTLKCNSATECLSCMWHGNDRKWTPLIWGLSRPTDKQTLCYFHEMISAKTEFEMGWLVGWNWKIIKVKNLVAIGMYLVSVSCGFGAFTTTFYL